MAPRRIDVRKLILPLAVIAAVAILSAQGNRRELTGHMRPFAVAGNDRGRIDAARTLQHVTLILQPSAAQVADLTALLANQQDSSSPDFHRWLTPDEYGARFGLAQAAIDQVTAWLGSQNLTVDSVGRGRTTIAFSGNVRDVERALQVEIHNYSVNGETHFANANEPSVPAAIGGFVRVVHGLDDYRMKPRAIRAATPNVKLPLYTSATTGAHYLAPNDISTIFDIAPLYNSGITGKGQKIVVVGQTKINLSDVEAFRSYFNLSANDPTLLLVPGSNDPGIKSGDLGEADLDVEWSGAIAKDASIIYVYSGDVEDSLDYAINQNLAPVITMSYGLCEASRGFADLDSLNSYSNQASIQGISWIAASGDNGGDDCYGQLRAPSGLSVDAPASVPGVTGIGGTTLTESGGTYWNSVNDANHASAQGFIPASVWNDSIADGSPSSGGGGASTYFVKPSWQTGAGVPNDGHRDVPDLALPASADHDPYLVYSGGSLMAFGGTSIGAPVFAGVTGLLNQYLVANGLQPTTGVGTLNPRLYGLAQGLPNVFHDITQGSNFVDSCASTARNCVPMQVGFNAGVGYDQASGLGSVDVFNLITAWAQSGTATALVVNGITSAASFQEVYAPGMAISLFGRNLALSTSDSPSSPLPTQLAGTTVTINGIPAPLYYVSPSQINLQIPWEIPKNSTAILKVVANGQTSTSQFVVAKSAPEIFGDTNSLMVPYQNTGRGQTVFLFATGDGLFSTPSVTTGAVPAAGTLSLPASSAIVTVGGVIAPTTFVGEPAWSIGVSQVNFTIPAGAPLGVQPVVVTVGSAASAPVFITVQ